MKRATVDSVRSSSYVATVRVTPPSTTRRAWLPAADASPAASNAAYGIGGSEVRSGAGVATATPDEGLSVSTPGDGGVGVGGGGGDGVGEGVAVTRGVGVRVGVGIGGRRSGEAVDVTDLVTVGLGESPSRSKARVAAMTATASEMAA